MRLSKSYNDKAVSCVTEGGVSNTPLYWGPLFALSTRDIKDGSRINNTAIHRNNESKPCSMIIDQTK